MKNFIAEAGKVIFRARKPGSPSARRCHCRAAAFRCALLALLALGLFDGVSRAQDAVKVENGSVSLAQGAVVAKPDGGVSVAKDLTVGNLVIAARNGVAPFKVTDSTGNVYFSVGPDRTVNLNNRFIVQPTGQVAMTGLSVAPSGETSPNDKLYVKGAAKVDGTLTAGALTVERDATIKGDLQVDNSSIYFGKASIQNAEGHNALMIMGRASADNPPQRYIVLSDRVGIGKRPGVTYALNVNGKVWADKYDNPSDRRLKKDIEPLGPALDRVLQLRPVTYRMKAESEDTPRSIGFIAQDVAPFFPETVGDIDGEKSLAYNEFIPVAVGAIQEMEAQVNDLKKAEARMAELEEKASKVDSLEREVAELKKLVAGLQATRTGERSTDQRLVTAAGH